jgi:hypothetical protein
VVEVGRVQRYHPLALIDKVVRLHARSRKGGTSNRAGL